MSFDYCTINDVRAWIAGLDVSDMTPNLDLLIEQQYIPWAKREVDRYIGQNVDLTTVHEFYDGSGNNELILRYRPVTFLRRAVLRLIPAISWFTFRRWFHLNEITIRGTKVTERGGVEPINERVNVPYAFISTDPVPEDLKTTDSGKVTASFNNTTDQYEKADLYIDARLGVLKIPPRILFLENQAVPFWNYTWLRGTSNIEVEYDYGYKDLESLPFEIRSACAQLVAAAILSTKGKFLGAGVMSVSLQGSSRSFGSGIYKEDIKSLIESAKLALAPHKRIRV